MTVLIIGLGSIAKKHIKALNELGPKAEFIALRSGKSGEMVKGVRNIYLLSELTLNPDFVIVSNPTSKHYETIEKVLSLRAPLFIEKPVLDSLDGAKILLNKIKMAGITTYVGCNLRFHPCIQYLKENLNKKTLFEANIYCGSYLPEWRPERDYRQVYSAHADLGGGVHLDLIHEIDYSYWLWGKPNSVKNNFERISDLEISSNDYAHYVLKYPDKMVHITLNYYRKKPKRVIELVFGDDIWSVDLLDNSITNMKDEIIFTAPREKMLTYKSQMEYFLGLIGGEHESINDFCESLEVLDICLNEKS